MNPLLDDPSVVQRILDHIDHRTTDTSTATWREPIAHYRSAERFGAELALVLRRYPTPFCPSAALPESGSYVARPAAGTPILAVRGADGQVRAFRNACRHRGTQLVDGAGCAKTFMCRFHGWTYGLDGRLRHVPHEDGFPGLDKGTRSKAPRTSCRPVPPRTEPSPVRSSEDSRAARTSSSSSGASRARSRTSTAPCTPRSMSAPPQPDSFGGLGGPAASPHAPASSTAPRVR
jgi:nitrite reductase/ring-hydroxylating ferredoxin subunit